MATLDELLDSTLPLNRKERYYTGTVLPALLCADSMRHLPRLGRLLGLGELEVRAEPEDCTVLFFTEYSLVESAVGSAADRFPGVASMPKDTPDVVILVTEPEPVLIALEAKMYDRPSRPDLVKQLAAQRAQLDMVCRDLAPLLGVRRVRLEHRALLPAQLKSELGGTGLGAGVVTWEEVRDAFADVDQRYFHAVLDTALRRRLASTAVSYQQGEMAGAKLVSRWLAGDCTWSWMGVQGGLPGKRLKAAIGSGTWATTVFQCRYEPLSENPNWFPVTSFVDHLRAAGVPVDALGPSPFDDFSPPVAR